MGTIYKDMSMRPSVLTQYMDDTDTTEACLGTDRSSYASGSDSLYIEDRTARLALTGGKIDPGMFVTGMVICCKGVQREGKGFEVFDSSLAGIPTTPFPPVSLNTQTSYIALISGLHIGEPTVDPVSLDILRDFFYGICGTAEMRSLSSKIGRVVIAGQALTASQTSSQALVESDSWLAQVAGHLHVDLMPGEGDPCGYSLPQSQFPPVLFTEAKRFNTFRSVSNPYFFSANGVRFMGSSGQPTDDICRFSNIDSSIDALEIIMRCRCLAPTAPDSLPSYPFQCTDPYCLDEQTFPHVVFSGNHKTADYKIISPDTAAISDDVTAAGGGGGSLAVCIPSFTETGEVVLVDLTNLDVKIIKLKHNEKLVKER
eukprot:GHVQ01026517.1.p1 GENE.GHVQ01026517.1~~GHVQ01026517.1.p1  ORF type:complete len:371 (-),score=47.40 GHVQ01026517.1:187-1299(-)